MRIILFRGVDEQFVNIDGIDIRHIICSCSSIWVTNLPYSWPISYGHIDYITYLCF